MVPGQFQVLNKLNPDKPVFPTYRIPIPLYRRLQELFNLLQESLQKDEPFWTAKHLASPGDSGYRFLQVNRRKSIENLQGIAMLTCIYIYIYVIYTYMYMLYIYICYIYVIYCYIYIYILLYLYIYCMLENMYVSWIMYNRMTLHFQIPSFTGWVSLQLYNMVVIVIGMEEPHFGMSA